MEDEANVPIDMSRHNRPIIREFSSQQFLESSNHSSFFGANPYTHTDSGPHTLSMIQGEPSIRDIHSDVSLTQFSTLQPYVNQHLYDVHSFPGSSPLNCDYSPFEEMGNRWLIAANGNASSGDWMSLVDQGSNNELSLSLSAYSRPPVFNGGSSSQGQCSDMSCSTDPPSHKNMSSGLSERSSEFPKILSQSRYLSVVQEILSEFSSFSLENVDHQLMRSPLDQQGDSFKGSDESFNNALSLRRRDTEAKKSQLLALLQMLDECYNQCADEIHTVISAFHAATELDPQTHARFALQTISVFYKSLKERISNQILRMGAYDDGPNGSNGGGGASGASSSDQNTSLFEKSFIQKRWALQQLKRTDQHLWRPQRGLPERSVSVLRAWMFQNFLHPYPKDTEKHLLAIKSGLTRSQVSNWFINARVRLWKPLIEEMYAELDSSRGGKGQPSNEQSRAYKRISISNPGLDASSKP